jgi:hypothetical protein
LDALPLSLTDEQLALIEAPLDAHSFVEGPAGAGKTTAGVERLLHIMAEGVPASEILLLVPQRTLARPYLEALRSPGVISGGTVSVVTVGGLAQRMIDLFWPLVAEPAGFKYPDRLPTFLTLETAQYYMAHLLQPLLAEGLFESVHLERNRLYSQVLDNLNKAAGVGFSHDQIGERLAGAWGGEPGQLRVYRDVQTSASLFRQYCLENNLLDFSLQLEVFKRFLWNEPVCRQYLDGRYRHLIYDNLEEDVPVAHDLVSDWLAEFDSCLLIFDSHAGYRRFLGADPESGYQLKAACQQQLEMGTSLVTTSELHQLEQLVTTALERPSVVSQEGLREPAPAWDMTSQARSIAGVRAALAYTDHRYYPQMLDWVAQQIEQLVHDQGLPAQEIVVLAPFLSDALRFSLMERLVLAGVPARSHRPSRSLRDEPATQALLTFASLANPEWGIFPSRFDVTSAFLQAIQGLDLVRAQLLTEIVLRFRPEGPELSPFDRIVPKVQQRITYQIGERYDALREWLDRYRLHPQPELDHFISRLFGEVLSQPGYGFHTHLDSGRVTANLVESIQKFRWVAGETLSAEGQPLGKEYLQMVQAGVIAAQYIQEWQTDPQGTVLIAPAYTYLMSNRPVEIQFWLDIGSRGWFERLYQPLTHPYVLSRQWQMGRLWTDSDEVAANQQALIALIRGLLNRCRGKVFLGLTELGEQGFEQRGPLLRALQRVLRQLPPEMEAQD